MNTRIAQLSRALCGGSTSVAGRSSEADTSATPYVPSQSSSELPSLSPTAVAVNGSPVVGALLIEGVEVAANAEEVAEEVVVEVAVDAGPSKKCRRKHKKRSKGSSKSSKCSRSRSERRAAKDAAEEKENTNHLKEMMVWWKHAREELKASSSTTTEMEGEKLIPDWAISTRSSVLRSLVGQDSWELYKACLLERDQVLFAQTAYTCVEEHIAHGVIESRVAELQKEISEAQQKEKDLLDAKAALEAKNADLKAQLHQAKEAAQEAIANSF
ncbi:hypothetical protein Salat_0842600 [Sesamum alatum]|uniref:Uncharacterized protein n=1 Tax=Sesamum alatum TaxID=300844 RepID=A0AAE1YIK1_9LAMI|nr:hypothetical protein Salat_0842600 [Sesamum alatum]